MMGDWKYPSRRRAEAAESFSQPVIRMTYPKPSEYWMYKGGRPVRKMKPRTTKVAWRHLAYWLVVLVGVVMAATIVGLILVSNHTEVL